MSRNSRYLHDPLPTDVPTDPHPDTARVAQLEVLLAERDEQLAQLGATLAATENLLDDAQRAVVDADARFHEVWSATPVGLALADEYGQYVAVNDALCRLLGRPENELIGQTSAPFTHPDDRHVHTTAQERARADRVQEAVEKRYVRPSGEIRWAHVTLTGIRGPHARRWTLACIDDITERRHAERTLQDSEQNLSAVARVTRRIQSGEDARSTIVDAVHEMTGAASAYLVEPLDDDTLVITTCSGDSIEGTTMARHHDTALAESFRNGQPLFLDDPIGSPVVSPPQLSSALGSIMWQPVFRGGRTVAVIMVKWPYRLDSVAERAARALDLLADETSVALAQDEMRAELRALARTDPLTGLPNRRSWDDQLAVVGEVAYVNEQPLVVAMIDLDHFKRYNDRHGHGAGDDHLREFARRARGTLRDSDLLARWGGEEFAVALPNCTGTAAQAILTRVLHSVPGDQTCSIGWATWDRVEAPESLMARVDSALYRAKENGRNRVVSAESHDPRTLAEK